jgi:hypothetical protein
VPVSVTRTGPAYQPSSPLGVPGLSAIVVFGAVVSSGKATWPERSGISNSPVGSSSVSAIKYDWIGGLPGVVVDGSVTAVSVLPGCGFAIGKW